MTHSFWKTAISTQKMAQKTREKNEFQYFTIWFTNTLFSRGFHETGPIQN